MTEPITISQQKKERENEQYTLSPAGSKTWNHRLKHLVFLQKEIDMKQIYQGTTFLKHAFHGCLGQKKNSSILKQ